MKITRRRMLKSSAETAVVAAALNGGNLLGGAQSQAPSGVNRNSAPSQLKITDMRACTVAANYDYPIIRIDTNQ